MISLPWINESYLISPSGTRNLAMMPIVIGKPLLHYVSCLMALLSTNLSSVEPNDIFKENLLRQ